MGDMGKVNMPNSIGQLRGAGLGMLRKTKRPRNVLLKQLTEALQTGGVGAKIPLIQQAVSQSNQANQAALTQTSEQLASRNIGGPFASRILAGQRQEGEQQTARLPTQIAEAFIAQTTPFLASTQSLGAGAVGQAASLEAQLDQFNAQQKMAMIGGIAKALGPSLSGLMGGSK